ncbi:MAG: N-glycosylase [Candidatus Altiarchaeales archaeon]|nr:MAG: N-glycosylase [Candidatus Altiarchaeales archaeon]
MEELIKFVKNISKKPEVKRAVNLRIGEFRSKRKESTDEIFKELCFCILTANFNAERTIKIQEEMGDGFLRMTEKQIAKKLKDLGYRFPNTRAKYIVEARKRKNHIGKILNQRNEQEIREWLVKNIRGIGYKEASHFLRNIGFENIGIIDFHIIDLLTKFGLIKKPKTLGKKKYLEIEGILKKLSEKLNINLARLDLYLWYVETGKILK